MITMEEYIKQNTGFDDGIYNYSGPKFQCPECKIGGMCKNLTMALTSYPPKFEYKCNNPSCRHIENLPF